MIANIKKKRIIFFLPNFSRGGASESIVKLSKFLKNHNYSILVISIGKNYYKKELEKNHCDVIEIKSKRAFFSIFKLRNLIKKEINKNFLKTIFISNIHYANVISMISCFKLKKIKVILTERSSITELNINNNYLKYLKNKLIFFLAKYLYRYSDLIITNSNFEKKFIKNTFKVKNIKFINPPSINFVKITKNSKNNFNKLLKIIYVGRLSEEKGVITILKALSKLQKFKFLLKIYGEGPEKENLQRFIKINNLNKKVLFKGFIKNKNQIFKDANLFINASWFEGLPNALVQSINNNIFPICSKSPGGNIEVIKNEKLGLSFKSNDASDLKKKILFFMKKKLTINQSIKNHHLKNYTEKNSNQSYLKTLNRL
tara:strand:- start:529 stop:1644 length:1116 start_codon:yes stop_codon:yes gene_type:complete